MSAFFYFLFDFILREFFVLEKYFHVLLKSNSFGAFHFAIVGFCVYPLEAVYPFLKYIFFVGLFFEPLRSFSQLATAAAADANVQSHFLCRRPPEVRSVSVIKSKGLFQTLYIRDGQPKVVASGQYQKTCSDVQANIVRNLESSGWKCSNVSERAGHSDL